MKRISFLIYIKFTVITLFLLTSLKSDKSYKRYGVESGFISYIYEGHAVGSKKVYFKNWGMTEVQIDNMQIEMYGMKQKTSHVVLLEDTKITVLNRTNQKTHQEKNTEIASLIEKNPSERDLAKLAYEEFKKSGGKKLGTEDYLGKKCDILEINGSKKLHWKGIPLKTELEVSNLKIIMKAVELKTNIAINDSVFSLENR